MKTKHFVVSLLLSTLLILSVLFAGACSYAHGNMQTLVTSNCGVTWSVVKQGQSLPAQIGVCSYHVTIPDYPMQGDSKFRTNFKNNVKADVDLSYNYRITEPLTFLSEAKYIGKQNTEDKDAKANDSRFEGAENAVIDRHIRDVQRHMLQSYDIVDFSPSDFEELLLPEVNKRLNPLGVQIDYLSFVPVPDDQTAQAIDVATALRIYMANGIPIEQAMGVIEAKAGAANLRLQPQEHAPPKQ